MTKVLRRGRRISRRVHVACQNIIYNEMGLSREGIERQVKEAVAAKARTLAGDGDMLNLADKVIMARIQHHRYAPAQLEKMVHAAIVKAVQELVMTRVASVLETLNITITPK